MLLRLPFHPGLLSAALIFAFLCPGYAAPAAAGEVRAIWVTRWDWKTATDVERAIRWAAGIGLNRVFFQVRGRADAFYPSSIEPWGEEIGGIDPGFDPLATAIAAAKRAGIELHAWVNVTPGWKSSELPRDRRHVLHRHPEWFLVDRAGKRHLANDADYTILNPCLPEVRAHIVSVIEDIALRYAVDGVQLDYIRFIKREKGAGGDLPFDPRTLALFRKHSGGSPFDLPGEWDRFRASAVDTLVYRIQEAVRKVRPAARITVAAIQDYDRARKVLFQDVLKWRERGWIDEIYPMIYQRDDRDFSYAARSAIGRSPRGSVIPGIGVHLHRSAFQTVTQIQAARTLGGAGYSLFGFANLFPSPSHESRKDPESKRLRASLRASVLAANSAPGPVASGAPAPAPAGKAQPPEEKRPLDAIRASGPRWR